jgi:hypothetical protein
MEDFRLDVFPTRQSEEYLVDPSRLVMSAFISLASLKTTQRGDTTFGRVAVFDPNTKRGLQFRARWFLLHLAARLVRVMNDRVPGAVERVFLVAVPAACAGDPAPDILRSFLEEPDILDCSKLWGYRIMVELADHPGKQAQPIFLFLHPAHNKRA